MKQIAKDSELITEIERLKAEHPFWGYRRVWVWLKFKINININQKRVYRLMKLNNLLVKEKLCKAKRTPQTSKPKPTAPNQWWGIDMTKVLTNSGWVYLVLVVDWFTKEIVGFEVDYQSKTRHWQNALSS